MTERRLARRYDLTLPVSIRSVAEKLILRQEGKTRDISTKGLYFVVDRDLEAGSELDLTLTLPGEITHGSDVFVRAQGKVVRIERRLEEGKGKHLNLQLQRSCRRPSISSIRSARRSHESLGSNRVPQGSFLHTRHA